MSLTLLHPIKACIDLSIDLSLGLFFSVDVKKEFRTQDSPHKTLVRFILLV